MGAYTLCAYFQNIFGFSVNSSLLIIEFGKNVREIRSVQRDIDAFANCFHFDWPVFIFSFYTRIINRLQLNSLFYAIFILLKRTKLMILTALKWIFAIVVPGIRILIIGICFLLLMCICNCVQNDFVRVGFSLYFFDDSFHEVLKSWGVIGLTIAVQ